jgi:uncharacterized protein
VPALAAPLHFIAISDIIEANERGNRIGPPPRRDRRRKRHDMRLTDEQRDAIREAVRRRFGPDAKVFLFGSRVDDARRGGDIDLLVELPTADPGIGSTIDAKLMTLTDIQRRIGERKIDLVVAYPQSDKPIIINARRQAVPV